MFKNMINAISKPKSVFLRIRDKGYKVLLYVLLLGFIMTIPVFLKAVVDRESLFVSNEQISREIYHILDEGIEIKNNTLNSNHNNIKFNIGLYIFIVGEPQVNEVGYVISLEENEAVIYFSSGQGILIKASSVSYDKMAVKDLEFTSENKGLVTNLLVSSFTKSSTIIFMILVETIFSNVLNIVFIALFLSLLASISRKIPLKYSHHFKVNVYLATIYAFVILILNLFNLGGLSIIALLIVYFYHFRVYNTVRLIPTVKGGGNSE